MKVKKEISEALFSELPDKSLGEKLNLFGQFVGEWDFECIEHLPDGTTRKETGEWIFSWALEGRVIQDVWIVPKREKRKDKQKAGGEYGATVRFYDPENNNWKVVWIGPVKNRLFTFTASEKNEEIIMQTNNLDFDMKWIFSQIQKDSFHWRSIISEDQGKNWKLTQEMNVRRK